MATGRMTLHLEDGMSGPRTARTANLRTKILDFRGFDSSIILI